MEVFMKEEKFAWTGFICGIILGGLAAVVVASFLPSSSIFELSTGVAGIVGGAVAGVNIALLISETLKAGRKKKSSSGCREKMCAFFSTVDGHRSCQGRMF